MKQFIRLYKYNINPDTQNLLKIIRLIIKIHNWIWYNANNNMCNLFKYSHNIGILYNNKCNKWYLYIKNNNNYRNHQFLNCNIETDNNNKWYRIKVFKQLLRTITITLLIKTGIYSLTKMQQSNIIIKINLIRFMKDIMLESMNFQKNLSLKVEHVI